MNPSALPALAWFVHIARHRSFTKAAAEMGVSRAALSQQLKALERQLGVALLYRTTRDMSLTEAGQRLFDALQPAFATIEQAVRDLDVAATDPTGVLRVNTSRIAAQAVLEPHLAEFHARHPKLALELVMEERLSNIIAEGCDAGIRLGRSLAEHMVAVPVTPPLSMAVVGSPGYFARHGVPATPFELSSHDCINYRYSGSGALHDWDFTDPRDGHDFTMAVTGSLTTHDDAGMIRAALQGVGLAQHLDIAVQGHLDAGTLVRVLQDWRHKQAGFYLYVPSRERMPPKVRALMDFLVGKREAMSASG